MDGITTYNITASLNTQGQPDTVSVSNVTNISSTYTLTGPPGADGPQGPQGPQGIQGIQGIEGPTGAAGAAATIAAGTTTTGAAGTNASVTNSGTSSAATFDFTIPQGATGATGATGAAATIGVGTTTTLAPGASATVTNSGTSSAATFDFGIPGSDVAATTTSEGIIQLAGDLGGTATAPEVLSTHLSAALPIAQGGTGSTTQNFVDLTSAQIVGGVKELTDNLGLEITPTYGLHQLGGGQRLQALENIAPPTVTVVGTAGTTSYTYYVVATDRNGGKTQVSGSTTITTGNATLSSTNYNNISWSAIAGAVSYDILKTNTSTSLATGVTGTSFNDTGQATASYTPPNINTTANTIIDGQLGIGTTTPYQNKYATFGNGGQTPNAGATGLYVDSPGGGGFYMGDKSNNAQGKYEVYGGAMGVGTMTNHDLQLFTNNSIQILIDTSGNVTIENGNLTVNKEIIGLNATLTATGSSTVVPLAIVVNSSGVPNGFTLSDDTNYAQTADMQVISLLNSTDSGNGLTISNAGTGKNINSTNGSATTFSVDKAGNVTMSGDITTGGGQIAHRTSVTAAYTVLTTDYILGVNGLTAAITITLPTAVGVTGQTYIIKDEGGQAATYNITIATASQTIDGASTYVMNTNYQSLTLVSNGANWSIL